VSGPLLVKRAENDRRYESGVMHGSLGVRRRVCVCFCFLCCVFCLWIVFFPLSWCCAKTNVCAYFITLTLYLYTFTHKCENMKKEKCTKHKNNTVPQDEPCIDNGLFCYCAFIHRCALSTNGTKTVKKKIQTRTHNKRSLYISLWEYLVQLRCQCIERHLG